MSPSPPTPGRTDLGGENSGGSVGARAARILLVDRHRCFRQALAILIGREPGLGVTAQADTLSRSRRLLRKETDLVVVDHIPPGGEGAGPLRELRRCNPGAAVLVLTANPVTGLTLEPGADGVLQKSAGVDEIVGAIRQLAAGRTARPRRPLRPTQTRPWRVARANPRRTQ